MKGIINTLRRLAPIIVIVVGFAAIPPLGQKLFPPQLPIASLRPLATRRPLPEFKFEDATGRTVSLNRFRGTFVLLNVWAAWCLPCKEEMPSLNRLGLRFVPENLKVVPISIDVAGASIVRAFYKRMGLDRLPIYIDPSKNVMRSLGIVGIPTTILIDSDGLEVGRFAGAAQWDAPTVVSWLSQVVADDHSDETTLPSINGVQRMINGQASPRDSIDAAQEIQLMLKLQ